MWKSASSQRLQFSRYFLGILMEAALWGCSALQRCWQHSLYRRRTVYLRRTPSPVRFQAACSKREAQGRFGGLLEVGHSGARQPPATLPINIFLSRHAQLYPLVPLAALYFVLLQEHTVSSVQTEKETRRGAGTGRTSLTEEKPFISVTVILCRCDE